MNHRLHELSQRIRNELVDLERLVTRAEEAWRRACLSEDDYYWDSVALNLHGWYSGLERIFVLIAETLDHKLPEGENWHQKLLEQMTREVVMLRPAIISQAVNQQLADYRGFRHVVRNVYTFRFDPAKMEKLVAEAPKVFQRVEQELIAFAEFLEQDFHQRPPVL
jgi:hypothetical protein